MMFLLDCVWLHLVATGSWWSVCRTAGSREFFVLCGDVIPVPDTAFWWEISGVVPGIGRIHPSSLGHRLIVSLLCCCHWGPQLLSLPPPLCPPPQCPSGCPSLVCQSVSYRNLAQLFSITFRAVSHFDLRVSHPTLVVPFHAGISYVECASSTLLLCAGLSQGILCFHLETFLGW